MQEIRFREDILPLKDKIFRLALRITFNRAEAEDIVQETLIRVWNHRDELFKIESVEAYCLTIARNLAIDASQKKEAKNQELAPEHDRPVDASTPFDTLVHKEQMAFLHQLINRLPEKQRLIFHLRDVEGHSYQEIASIMKLSEEQVKVNLFRARQKIKQQFIKIEGYGL